MHLSTTLALASVLLVVNAPSLQADDQRAQEARRNARTPEADQVKLDLNTADEKTLAAVPVIGADVARAIVAARPFSTVHELDRLPGLSAERLEQIRATVTIRPAAAKDSLGFSTAPDTGPKAGERDSLGLPKPARDAEPDTAPSTRLDLNTAPERTLAAHPVIGPELAAAIVAARPFRHVDELNRIQRLSTPRLEQIRAIVAVDPATVPRAEPARR